MDEEIEKCLNCKHYVCRNCFSPSFTGDKYNFIEVDGTIYTLAEIVKITKYDRHYLSYLLETSEKLFKQYVAPKLKKEN